MEYWYIHTHPIMQKIACTSLGRALAPNLAHSSRSCAVVGTSRRFLALRNAVNGPSRVTILSPARYFVSSRALFQDNSGKPGKSTDPHHIGSIKVDKPQYMLAFTCKKCNHRSSHTISKQAYHHGTVMVKCPKCNNRHLIADHLKIFNDSHITIEDIMKAKGETVSQSTDDLVFDDIPESLKPLIGHYAKDAPEQTRAKLDNETVHTLPPGNKTSK